MHSFSACTVWLWHVFVGFLIQDGTTPLFMASQNGHPEVVELLLQNSATVDAQREVSLLCPCTNHYSSLVWMVGHLDTCVVNTYIILL